MDVDQEIMIPLIEERPVIWDKTNEIYKDRVATAIAWKEVCSALDESFEKKPRSEMNAFEKEVMKKWKTVRDGFRKSLERISKAKKSGAPASKIKKYVYNDQLQFLRKLYESDLSVKLEDAIGSDAESGEDSRQDSYAGELSMDIRAEVEAVYDQPGSSSCTEASSEQRKKSKRRRIKDEPELGLLNTVESPNRHMYFFKGLMPSLESFDDDEVLEFQMGVLSVVKNIKRVKQQKLLASSSYSHDPLEPGVKEE